MKPRLMLKNICTGLFFAPKGGYNMKNKSGSEGKATLEHTLRFAVYVIGDSRSITANRQPIFLGSAAANIPLWALIGGGTLLNKNNT